LPFTKQALLLELKSTMFNVLSQEIINTMNKLLLLPAIFLVVACIDQAGKEVTEWSYPETRKADHVDNYHGTDVPDPYRWLEDDNSEETAQWVERQNMLTHGYLAEIPFKSQVKKRLEELENYAKYSQPSKEGDYYYFLKNEGLQNQSIMYRSSTLDAEPEVFLDPNEFSEDGTTSLSSRSFSKDAKYFAYSISVSGSDWREIYIMDVETKDKLPDKIEWAKFTGISWFKDGFFYQRFPKPKEGDELKSTNTFHKIYYHNAGTPQDSDQLIFENKENPENRFFASVTDDERFLIIYSTESTSGNKLFLRDLSKKDEEFISIVDNFENDHTVIGNIGDRLLLETNLNSPNNKVIEVDYNNPTPENWKDIIPETENVLSAGMAGGKIIATYLVDAKTSVKQFDDHGVFEWDIELPAIGTARGFSGDVEDNEIFYTFTSFTYPSSIFRYDLASGESVLYKQPNVDFNPEEYETKQIFYSSKDGTKIPMFIVHRKGLELDGNNPTYLYAYGGFNISLRPSFSASRILWLENGGIYAQPNLRGGGEYGEEWHKAGTKMQKQNVFDDFIAAGEYLIEHNFTSNEYLAIAGGSNGGLLIGATLNQRPDLAKVAFPAVGVMDMLRYQNFTIGRAWATDYGTAEESKEMFEYLLAYSPLHNIRKDIAYPSVLVTTADHDDRVVPAHSFKYGATLQAHAGWGSNPLLIRIETKAGHGGGTPISKRIEQNADRYSFAWYNMGIVPELAKESL